jgi:hypothetical protein
MLYYEEGEYIMFKRNIRILLAASMLVLMIVAAGCGGSSDAKRISGLSTTETVTTFFDAAKNNRMSEAGLYVSAASKSNSRTVLKFMTGSAIEQIKNANIVSIKQVAQQGNYAAVVATVQEQNSLKMSIKPIGLEKVNGEWYIVDFDQIYNDAKYKVLQQLLANI